MRWPWPRRHNEPIDADIAPAREAADALQAARDTLAEAQRRQPQVDRAVAAHKRLQWRNHLGEQVHRALSEGGAQ